MLSAPLIRQTSVTLEEIDSAGSLVQNLEKIELPSQLVAVLADPLLRKLLLLIPQAQSLQRISNGLSFYLSDVLDGTADDGFSGVLEVLRDYATHTKVYKINAYIMRVAKRI